MKISIIVPEEPTGELVATYDHRDNKVMDYVMPKDCSSSFQVTPRFGAYYDSPAF